MSDDFNCEFADVCDFVCYGSSGCVNGCINDTVCPFYKELKV